MSDLNKQYIKILQDRLADEKKEHQAQMKAAVGLILFILFVILCGAIR